LEPAGVTPEAIEVSTVGCAVIGLVGPDDAEAFRAIRALFAAGPKLGIIAVGKAGSTDLILSAMRAGARDYLPRPVRPEALVETVRRQLERSAADRAAAHAGLPPAFDLLSQRECEVLDLVVRGHSTKQIAAQIGRVEKTVEYHRKRIMDKLGVNTAVQLVRLVTLHGWRGEEPQGRSLAT
jgi:two-component system CheB/CheR fusion protein